MSNYKHQVSLLLQVLPEVAKEPVFALHGGTGSQSICKGYAQIVRRY